MYEYHWCCVVWCGLVVLFVLIVFVFYKDVPPHSMHIFADEDVPHA